MPLWTICLSLPCPVRIWRLLRLALLWIATISGYHPFRKNDFDQVSLSLRNNLEVNEQALKWDNKTKSYVLEVSDPGLLLPDALSRYSIILGGALEKDKKIDKQIAARSILWDFNAATGILTGSCIPCKLEITKTMRCYMAADGFILVERKAARKVFLTKKARPISRRLLSPRNSAGNSGIAQHGSAAYNRQTASQR